MKTRMVFLAAFFLFFTTKLFAYEFTTDFTKGFYWEKFPLTISVAESDPVKKQELIKLLDQAIIEWERHSGIDLWTRVENSSNVLKWADNFYAETGYSEQSTLAVTTRNIVGPYVRQMKIILNKSHGLNSYPKHLQTVIIHELGHTIGLDHSYQMGAVMQAEITLFYNGLHGDDIDGLSEVSNQTITRQESRYVSPLAYSSDEGQYGPSCGTVSSDNLSGGGPGSMLFSLCLGLLFIMPSRKKAPLFK